MEGTDPMSQFEPMAEFLHQYARVTRTRVMESVRKA